MLKPENRNGSQVLYSTVTQQQQESLLMTLFVQEALINVWRAIWRAGGLSWSLDILFCGFQAPIIIFAIKSGFIKCQDPDLMSPDPKRT
jgi:hypothetical protein